VSPDELSEGQPDDELVPSIWVQAIEGLPPTAARHESRHLAAAARRIITQLVSTSAGADALAEAADRLEAVVELFDRLPGGHGYEGFSEAANAGSALGRAELPEIHEDRLSFFDHSPIVGASNPLAPPLTMMHDPDDPRRVLATVTYGPAYEGPPGCVHGGFVAAAFDELLGAAQSLSGRPGMTAHLEVDYRSPTPLGRKLEMAAWLDHTEGRKIFASAEITADGALCAEASALFVSFGPGRFAELIDARDPADPPGAPPS
jgi:acyl-coenzyme A thioesterase PaaI-like protein